MALCESSYSQAARKHNSSMARGVPQGGMLGLLISLFLFTQAHSNSYDNWPYVIRSANETRAIRLVERLINQTDYRVRPNVYGAPLNVMCDFYVQNIGSIDAVHMDFQVDVFFRQKWKDERFAFTEQEDPVIIPSQMVSRFWVPDIFFTNEKSGYVHDITVPNQVIKIFPSGLIRLSTRMTLKLSCPMILRNYPLDYQDCHMRFSSYSYTTKDVTMEWGKADPVELNRVGYQIPQFELLATEEVSCDDKLSTGSFPCLKVIFHLKRQFGYYLLQAYVPSLLIVILSWVSFWVHKEAVPARITLGVTTVLTMTTQLTSSDSQSITVSYAKAIDIWYASCMILVFSALVEYAIVNSLMRIESKREKQDSKKRKNSVMDCTIVGIQDILDIQHQPHENGHKNVRCTSDISSAYLHSQKHRWTSDNVDHFARIVFPIVFITFNTIYWILFTQQIVHMSS